MLVTGKNFNMKSKLFSLTSKDFTFEFFRGTGHGGQNINKVETCVRIIHKASGAVESCCEERSQYQNKVKAFKKLTQNKKFKNWLRIEAARMMGVMKSDKEIEKEVDELMDEKNMKIEFFKPDNLRGNF